MNTLLGILAAFGTAAAKSATDISTKSASNTMDARPLLAITCSIGAAILICLTFARYPALLLHPIATLDAMTTHDYWWVLALDGTLNVVASYFYVRAFKYSDASLVAPLMLLTPIFMLVTSPLMLGESIPPLGILGILFAVHGSYLLGKNGGNAGAGLLAPFRELGRDRGVRSMLVTVTIWSVTSNLDKMGVMASTPLLWGASLFTLVAVYSVLFWLAMRTPGEPARVPWQGAAAGCGLAAQAVMQNHALTLLMVPYVIAIKRTSAVMTVMLGGALLREATGNRLAGALIMMLGTVLMVFASYA